MDLILTVISANVAFLTILGFLARSLLKHWIDKDIERFKNNLTNKSEITFNEYKAKLEKERIKLQISYAGIFEKQANATLELHRLLGKLSRSVSFAAYDNDVKETDYKKFFHNLSALIDHFEDNKVLVPQSVEAFVESFYNNVFNGVDDYRRVERQIRRSGGDEKKIDELFTKQRQIQNELDKIPEIQKELTNKFRRVIGIID